MRAMDALASSGLVNRVHGSGTFIANISVRRSTPNVSWALADQFRVGLPIHSRLGAAVMPSIASLPAETFDLSREDFFAADAAGSGYGIPGLGTTRRAIAQMLGAYGVETTADNVIVTTGATQALSLVFAFFLRPLDVVIVDRRAYPTTLALLQRIGVRVIAASETSEGYTDPASAHRLAVENKAAMVITMSTCNAATGATIPLARRAPFFDLATHRGVVIVDDRSLADYHPNPAFPALQSALHHPNMISLGSLNKIFWGGLRLGWLHLHESLVESFVRLKSSTDNGSSLPSQLIANRLLPLHQDIAAQRREDMTDARRGVTAVIEENCPEWRIEGSPVGPTMWVRLPLQDAGYFVQFAFERGIDIGYGGNYRADGRRSSHIRIALTAGTGRVVEDSSRLVGIWQEHLAGRPSRE